MGCGAGVTSVCAAQAGCAVTALDISPVAVRNTRLNAARHGVAEHVDARRGDLFEAVAPDERFDVIYWNSNFALAPSGFEPRTELEHAFFDPGYETHRRFAEQAPRFLRRGGRLLLGFADIGSWEHLRASCEPAGLRPRIVRSERRTLEIAIEFQLVALERPSR